VAVRADEFAFRKLRMELPSLPITSKVADVLELLRSRKVIPLHCGRMESPATIGARSR